MIALVLLLTLLTGSVTRHTSPAFPADSAINALSAPSAVNALFAPSAVNALSAPSAVNALSAPSAVNALSALSAVNALSAPSALNALSAPSAVNTLSAPSALNALSAPSAVNAFPPSAAPSTPRAQRARQQPSCTEAAEFARKSQRMIARIDPDTIDDWRTHKRLPGCRVTAAGATSIGVGEEAKRFYERLRAAGWTRTPDPRDAPREASLRFRMRETDCVFNIYAEATLGTDAEIAVNDSLETRPGESRYQLLVLCMPALPADPR